MARAVTRHKYGAKPMVMDGTRFDSMGEAARWIELQIAANQGDITELQRQVRFALHAAGKPICAIVWDFQYVDTGRQVVEDFKGFETPMFKLKMKWFRAEYADYEVRISRSRGRRTS